jgi:hypothetical protein
MKTVRSLLIASIIAMSTGFMIAFHAGDATSEDSLLFEGKLPVGYRDWNLVSVAHEEGNLNDLRAVLGNDIAVQAYRETKLPFPDGSIIARLAWSYVPSEENNRVFGRTQSFVAGAPTNVQFMVKDTKKHASTGGWGFIQFNEGKPANIVVNDCFSCHVPVKDRDFIFTRYAP